MGKGHVYQQQQYYGGDGDMWMEAEAQQAYAFHEEYRGPEYSHHHHHHMQQQYPPYYSLEHPPSPGVHMNMMMKKPPFGAMENHGHGMFKPAGGHHHVHGDAAGGGKLFNRHGGHHQYHGYNNNNNYNYSSEEYEAAYSEEHHGYPKPHGGHAKVQWTAKGV